MAEKQCPDCKSMIDAEAKRCPHCRTKQGMGFLKKVGVVFFILFIFGVVMSAFQQKSPTESRTSKTSPIDEKMQKKRESFIQTGINQGLFYKVNYGGTTPEVWVDSVFYALPFDDKQKMINVVYAHAKTKNPDSIIVVRLINKMTGKKIGEYSESSGGLKLY